MDETLTLTSNYSIEIVFKFVSWIMIKSATDCGHRFMITGLLVEPYLAFSLL